MKKYLCTYDRKRYILSKFNIHQESLIKFDDKWETILQKKNRRTNKMQIARVGIFAQHFYDTWMTQESAKSF